LDANAFVATGTQPSATAAARADLDAPDLMDPVPRTEIATLAPSGFSHFGGQRFKVVELAGFNCQLNPPRDLIAHYMDPDVDDLISILIALACLYTDDGWLQVLL
jgi:hypothetical protein